MSYTFAINTPQTLHIIDEQEEKSYYGANQYWYKEGWKRTSGCGPTTYANLIHYLSQTNPKCSSLVGSDTTNKAGFIDLMNDVWDIVTPGPLGIYTTKQFSEHAIKYGQEKGILLHSKMIEIPICPLLRPTKYELSEFLINTLNNNLPVAFLNRTNGKLSNLSSWHWVTIIGFSPKDMKMEILDNGSNLYIDIGLWLDTSILGGGFVALSSI